MQLQEHTRKLMLLMEESLEIMNEWRHMHGLFMNQKISEINAEFESVKAELLKENINNII